MNESSNQLINEPTSRRMPWIMGLALIVFALLMFHQVLAPGVCLFSTDNNIGQANLGKANLPGDFLGAWSDSTYFGMPIGIPGVGWLSLLTWLLPLRMFVNWLHGIDLVLASLFAVLFLRRQRIGWPAIALGLLTAFWLGSNLTLTYAGHTGKYGVVMMAAAALVCISRAIAQRTSLLWAILSGGAIGFMFLEQLDVALFFGFVLGAYALFLAVRQWQVHRTWAKSAVALALMGGMGLLLAASTMLGTYGTQVEGAASMQTESPREKWDFVTQWSWPPDECIDFIAPGYMGWRSGEPDGPYWGRMGRSAGWEQTRQGFMNFKLENTYLGIIPILLALFAMLAAVMGWKRNAECRMQNAELRKQESAVSNQKSEFGGQQSAIRNPQSAILPVVCRPFTADRHAEIIFWGCIAVITLLLAFGKFFPLYALFYQLPMVSSIRNPNKFLQVFQLALGILSAYGLNSIMGSALKTSNKT